MTTNREPGKVVATVTTPADLAFLAAGKANPAIDVFEFRLDHLARELDEAKTVASQLDRPILITARHPDEGGINALSENQRFELVRRFLPFAQWLDLEVRTLRASKDAAEVAREAHESGVSVVASFHDFNQTPATSTLRQTVESARELGADIAKLAIHLSEMSQLFELTQIVAASQIPISAMGMGPLGKLSRLVLAQAGSVLNYGYLQEPNAPGQWSAEELKRLIGEL